MDVLNRLDHIFVLIALLHDSDDLSFRDEHCLVVGILTLVDLAVAIHGGRSCTTTLLLPTALFTLDSELAMRVALFVCHSNIKFMHVFHSLDDDRDIIDDNIAALISLKQQELACLLVVMSVDGRDRHLLINAHVV